MTPAGLKEILDKHTTVFSSKLGTLKGVKVKLQTKPDVTPQFFKARTIPLALREKVEAELERLESLGIIVPVQHSEWAAPVVPVLKQDGSMRLCGDYRVTINKAAKLDAYPLPRVEDLFAALSGGKYFTKLDMSQAYLQVPLDENSRELVTFNTHKGLFQYTRLPFGVSAAPAVFQRCMENLFQGCKGVSIYLNDLLVTGATVKEHLKNLDKVLGTMATAGLTLNQAKCKFLLPRVEYLGHVIDQQGLHPTKEKVKAIREAPEPQNVSELRSFLGIINYYAKFLPNLSTKLAPLYGLLQKQFKWTWGQQQVKAFQTAKNALQDDSLLVHYDGSKQLVLACDVSQYGLGGVLSHIMEDGQERPTAYTSRTLTAAEKNYSQLEKEALAVVFAVGKFHNYLYGRQFMIESDHQPLSYIFSNSKAISPTASSRIKRWALTLGAYSYTIKHKPGKNLGNADALSRLPQKVTTGADCIPGDLVNLLNHLSATTVTSKHIRRWTDTDPTLARVRQYILKGWPTTQLGEEFKPFKSRKSELTVLNGCIIWRARVIVPTNGQKSVLEELHEAHLGASKMKALARSYIWWPKMDDEIEKVARKCSYCQQTSAVPAKAPLHPWEWPAQPWSRLHLDFAGPYLGRMFLVLVDAHSKWLDVQVMDTITSEKTVARLRSIFSTHGLPQQIVTDNGPTFTSENFQVFMKQNGIKHTFSAPYHPSSNGLTERAVQTFKQALRQMQHERGSIVEKLSIFLFKYRITPHSTTGVPPAELLVGRKLRSRLDLLQPNLASKVQCSHMTQKRNHDSKKPYRQFHEGDPVYAENFNNNSNTKWLPGKIMKATGPLSYIIELSTGNTVRRHVDHIIVREQVQEQSSSNDVNWDYVDSEPPDQPTSTTDLIPTDQPSALRRSSRIRQPPQRFDASNT